MSTENFAINVRRSPLFAVSFAAMGIGGIALGLYIELYAIVFVGALALALGVSLYMFPALVVTRESVELRNLFGFTGRVIPHDGLAALDIRDGRLVIVYAGRRAELPRPNAKSLHPADWNFLARSIEEAQRRYQNSRKS